MQFVEIEAELSSFDSSLDKVLTFLTIPLKLNAVKLKKLVRI
jgi:hypothetical protein